MFATTSHGLLATLLLAMSVVGSSPVEVRSSGVTLPLAKRISTSGSPIHFVQHAQARATAMKQRAVAARNGQLDRPTDSSSSIATTSMLNIYYTTSVGIGSPPTNYLLMLETGGSNTFIGGDKPYKPTSTSVNTNQTVIAITVGNGANFTGAEWLDMVTISPDLVIPQQSIGIIEKPMSSLNLTYGIDGALGLGPDKLGLIQGYLQNEPGVEIPTVVHNLYEQGSIPKGLFSLYFAPTTDKKETNGEIMFGGIDASKYIGEINYVPITSAFYSDYFWGIDMSITYGNTTILPKTDGVLDSSCWMILIATDALARYFSITGSVMDDATGMAKLTPSQYDKLENLDFHIGNETYVLTPNAQIFPRSLNTYINGSKDGIYLIVASVGTPFGAGYDFVLGMAFLERFYTVYDATNARVGFAKTTYTDAVIN